MKKVFVNNLPSNVTEKKIKSLLSKSGEVAEATIPEEVSGERASYAIVVFERDEEADDACQRFNGAEFEGATITVTPAVTMRGDDSGKD